VSSLVQWIHLSAAVMCVGGIGFLLAVFYPCTEALNPELRDQLLRVVTKRFRWCVWAAIILMLTSGLYNIRLRAWEAMWGPYWRWLTVKFVLAFFFFTILLLLTLPMRALERFRARRQMWLSVAFALGMVVILISAYLRG
jgi:uncharacterized membrane protein